MLLVSRHIEFRFQRFLVPEQCLCASYRTIHLLLPAERCLSAPKQCLWDHRTSKFRVSGFGALLSRSRNCKVPCCSGRRFWVAPLRSRTAPLRSRTALSATRTSVWFLLQITSQRGTRQNATGQKYHTAVVLFGCVKGVAFCSECPALELDTYCSLQRMPNS